MQDTLAWEARERRGRGRRRESWVRTMGQELGMNVGEILESWFRIESSGVCLLNPMHPVGAAGSD